MCLPTSDVVAIATRPISNLVTYYRQILLHGRDTPILERRVSAAKLRVDGTSHTVVYTLRYHVDMDSYNSIIQVIYLTWWPMLRDSLIYMLSIIVLVVVISDSVIHW